MAEFEVLRGEQVLFAGGSLVALVRVLERELVKWEKVFPNGTPRFAPSGEQLKPGYSAIVQHFTAGDLRELNIEGEPHFQVFPLFASPEGRAIRALAEAGSTKELSALLQYWRIECKWSSEHLLDQRDEGGRAVRAAQTQFMVARAVAAQLGRSQDRSRAEEASTRLQSDLEATEAAAEAFRNDMAEITRARAVTVLADLAAEKRRRRARRKYERKLVAVWKKRFDATHDAYVQKLQFEAPVTLWSTAARGHRSRSRYAFWAFVGLALFSAVVAVWGIVAFGDNIANAYLPANCPQGTSNCAGAFSPKGPLLTGALLLAASIAVWLLRTTHRVYVREQSLGQSAEERRAFAETYLALIKDEKVTRDQEAIVMAALFRPSSEGHGQDDGGIDFSSAAVLAKIMSGRSA